MITGSTSKNFCFATQINADYFKKLGNITYAPGVPCASNVEQIFHFEIALKPEDPQILRNGSQDKFNIFFQSILSRLKQFRVDV